MPRQLSFKKFATVGKRKSHARREYLPLTQSKSKPDPDTPDRDTWIGETFRGFVSRSAANKEYYRVILELLWPHGHGIPGPHITEEQMREAIDSYRKKKHTGPKPYRNYVDVFRRVRELQGEEGVVGIARSGKTYQLVDLKLAGKRIPRTKLNDIDWAKVVAKYNNNCAVCGRSQVSSPFQQDHKVPRVRGGGDGLSNWQPLCDECNNFKSTACRGCELDCSECPWAFPEKVAPLRISAENINRIRRQAERERIDPHVLINRILDANLGD